MIGCNLIVLVTICSLVLIKADEMKTKTGSDEISSRIMFPNDFLLSSYQHSYRRRTPNQRNGDIHFPEKEAILLDDSADVTGHEEMLNKYKNSSHSEIPLDFIRDINQYNVSDLLLNFVEGDMEYEDDPFVVKSRFGEDYEARSAAITPKAAGCSPELTTISLASSNDPSILYIPQCTKVERCGGCCSHDLLSCQPQEIETLTFKVSKTQYRPEAKKLKFLGKELITVEKHTKCKCDCKIKEEVVTANCNQYQEYRPSLCRCICTNSDEEAKCNKSSSKKLWNSELCACQCRDIFECSTGYYYDQIECRCMANPKRRFANYNRRGYVTESLTISPLPVDD